MLEIETISVDASLVDKLHRAGEIQADELAGEEVLSGYLLLRTETGQSALAVAVGPSVLRVVDPPVYCGIKPRDKQQVCFLHAVQQFNLSVALGGAGTGKTTLALAYAIHRLMKEDRTVVLCKPTRLVGGASDAWGTLPGGTEEKMQPYMESFLFPLRKLLGDSTQMYMDKWVQQGKVIIQPLETIRGMSFENCTVILDEFQNCTAHELLSFVSRVAENSKCILLGDPSQIDIDCKWRDTGAAQFLTSGAFFHSKIAKGVKLTAQYRGPLAQLAADVLAELNGEEEED